MYKMKRTEIHSQVQIPLLIQKKTPQIFNEANEQVDGNMFDNLSGSANGDVSFDNINNTITNILESQALQCNESTMLQNSDLFHARQNLINKFDKHILEYSKFKNNVEHMSSVIEGKEGNKTSGPKINSEPPKPQSKKRGQG